MKRRTFLGRLGALFLPTVAIAKPLVENKITPPSQEEDFFQFFLNFNGFPINEAQRGMYRFYANGYSSNMHSRRVGVSTFLLTLAAFESSHGKRVVHFSSNALLCENARDCYNKNTADAARATGCPTAHFDICNIAYGVDGIRGKRYDLALLDQSSPYYHRAWSDVLCAVNRCHMLKTSDSIIYAPYIPIIKTA